MSFWSIPSIEPKRAFRWYVSFGDRNYSAVDSITKSSIPHWACKKVTKPSYSIKTSQHKYLGVHNFNYPNGLMWNPVQLTITDIYDIAPEFKDEKNLLIIPSKPFRLITKREDSGGNDQSNSVEAKRSIQLFFYNFLREAGYIDPNERSSSDYLDRFRKVLLKKTMVGAFVGKNENYNPNGTNVDETSWNTFDIIEVNADGVETERWKLFNPLITDVKFGELNYENDGEVDINVDISYDWAELVPVVSQKVSALAKEQKDNIEKAGEQATYLPSIIENIDESNKKKEQKIKEAKEKRLSDIRKQIQATNFAKSDYNSVGANEDESVIRAREQNEALKSNGIIPK